jgi:hypothetical protein
VSLVLLPAPPAGFASNCRYRLRPREKRAFHTVLDAHQLIDVAANPESTASISRSGDHVEVRLTHGLAHGQIREHIVGEVVSTGIRVRSLDREVFDGERKVRHEQVFELHHARLGLPEETYPEVALPFLLGWMPMDGTRRSLYAWINDRFVARVYVESGSRVKIDLPLGRVEAVEVEMYPDLNDWVRLGSVLTKLAKPFLPKYRMWFEPSAPHRLLRFEGPYGPPGAPEITLELM